jgi:adenylyltransferase/sulfurtransferase
MINGIPQIAAAELKRRLDAGEDLFILDVREVHEYQAANLGGTLIPMNDVPRRLGELDREREIVVHCHAGVRSQRVAEFLRQAGFAKVSNLTGGILAWGTKANP